MSVSSGSSQSHKKMTVKSVVATTTTASIVAALIVGLIILPEEQLPADTPTESSVAVSEQVSPKQITQYCPAQMNLADTESYGDAEFHASVGNLQSQRSFTAFGSIFHSQWNNLDDTNATNAQVLSSASSEASTDQAVYVGSSNQADNPAVFETRVLRAQAGTGTYGSLGSWATQGDIPGLSASMCVSPQLTQNYLVPATTTGNTQQLVLANVSDKSTTVQIAAWSAESGQLVLATSSLVTVGANAQTTVMLNAAAADHKALYVTVRSQNTPVAGVIRSIAMDGLTAKGNDFIMPLQQAATEQALPLGSVDSTPTIYAFSEKNSTVTLSWITEQGLTTMTKLNVEAGKVAMLEAKDAPKNAIGVYAQSDNATSVAMLVDKNGENSQRDYAFVNASSAVAQSALTIPQDFSARLSLLNMKQDKVSVKLQGYDKEGKETGTKTVDIKGRSGLIVAANDIGKNTTTVRVNDQSQSLVWGAFLSNTEVSDANLAGVAYLPAASLAIPEQVVSAENNASIVH